MEKYTYCPFIKGTCRSDCVFHHPVDIALNGGKHVRCELDAFISCSDSDTVAMVSEAIKNLVRQKE